MGPRAQAQLAPESHHEQGSRADEEEQVPTPSRQHNVPCQGSSPASLSHLCIQSPVTRREARLQRTQTQAIGLRPSVSRYESAAPCSCPKRSYKHRLLSNPRFLRKDLTSQETIKQSLRVLAVKKKGSSKPSTFPHLRATGGLHSCLPVRKSSDSRGISTLKLGMCGPSPGGAGDVQPSRLESRKSPRGSSPTCCCFSISPIRPRRNYDGLSG